MKTINYGKLFLAGVLVTFLCASLSIAKEPASSLEVPDDFLLFIKSGPVSARMGQATFYRIRHAGGPKMGPFVLDIGKMEMVETDEETSKLKPIVNTTIAVRRKKVLEVCREIQEQGFFKLEDSYEDLEVNDGSIMTVTVTSQGKTKSVKLVNTKKKEIDGILKIVYEMADID